MVLLSHTLQLGGVGGPMKFTLAMLLTMVLANAIVGRSSAPANSFDVVALLGGLTWLAALAAIPLYWTARVVRRAWRDGTREH